MDSKTLIPVAVATLVVAGAAFGIVQYDNSKDNSRAQMAESSRMEQQKAEGAAMEKEKNGDAMVKEGDAMEKPDGDAMEKPAITP